MILYKTQPKSSDENTVINLSTKEKILNDVRDCIPNFKGRTVKFNDVTSLVTDASLVDGMIASGGYQNILVVPSFENGDYVRLRDRQYRPVRSAGDHLLPIVHALNETQGNLYVAQPKIGNIFNELYEKYDVSLIHVDSWFRVDSSFDINIDERMKFDCVVLLGNEGYKRGKFNAQAVKKKFARYCTPEFDMIDVYRGNLRELTGGSKPLDNHIANLTNAINTPTIISTPNRKYTWDFLEALERDKHRFLYRRLLLTVETIKEWYKVY